MEVFEAMPRRRQLFYMASELVEEEEPLRRDVIQIKGGGA